MSVKLFDVLQISPVRHRRNDQAVELEQRVNITCHYFVRDFYDVQYSYTSEQPQLVSENLKRMLRSGMGTEAKPILVLVNCHGRPQGTFRDCIPQNGTIPMEVFVWNADTLWNGSQQSDAQFELVNAQPRAPTAPPPPVVWSGLRQALQSYETQYVTVLFTQCHGNHLRDALHTLINPSTYPNVNVLGLSYDETTFVVTTNRVVGRHCFHHEFVVWTLLSVARREAGMIVDNKNDLDSDSDDDVASEK